MQYFLLPLISIVVAFTAIATALDMRFRLMPNWLTVPTAAAGLAFHAVRGWFEHEGSLGGVAWEIMAWPLAGFVTGFGLFFAMWLFGFAGGGDVKFMGAIGAWLGASWMMAVFFIAALFIALGGVVVMGMTIYRRGFRGVREVTQTAPAGKRRRKTTNERHKTPYALPVTLAVWVLFAAVLLNHYAAEDRVVFLVMGGAPAAESNSTES